LAESDYKVGSSVVKLKGGEKTNRDKRRAIGRARTGNSNTPDTVAVASRGAVYTSDNAELWDKGRVNSLRLRANSGDGERQSGGDEGGREFHRVWAG
jgi:hypothetical protein